MLFGGLEGSAEMERLSVVSCDGAWNRRRGGREGGGESQHGKETAAAKLLPLWGIYLPSIWPLLHGLGTNARSLPRIRGARPHHS